MKGFKNYKAVLVVVGLVAAFALLVPGLQAQMEKPKPTVLTGILVDMTCAMKGMTMMGSDYNAVNNDHKTPKGVMPNCGVQCLQASQPAGIYADGKIKAVLLADASQNLYKFGMKKVDVKGLWVGEKDDAVKAFVPQEIRLFGTEEWTKVEARAMHE